MTKYVLNRRRFAAVVAGAAVAALAGTAVPALAAEPEPTLDFRPPAVFGAGAEPTAFDTVITNPGPARPNVKLSLRIRPGVFLPPASHYDLAFRNPVSQTWQRVDLVADENTETYHAVTPALALPAASSSTVRLSLGYHIGAGDAEFVDVRDLTFDVSLTQPAPSGDDVLDTAWAQAQVRKPSIWFARPPATIKAGGRPATVAVRYDNTSDSAYQRVRPFLYVEGYTAGLRAANTKVERLTPTGTWQRLAVTDGPNGLEVTFTDAQRLTLAPRSGATVTLRVTVAGGPAGGRAFLRVNGSLPMPDQPEFSYELNHDGVYVDVTK